MHADVVDLREFYLTPLGLTVRRLLRRHICNLWPTVHQETILALGYGIPLLRPLLKDQITLIGMMPAEQGVAYWPREGPNISSFVDTENLPLENESVDRIILLHALEGSSNPMGLLRESWRVLRSGGRLLLIVPNRRGLWAHSDRTPFGTGRPYSKSQIRETLRDHGFLINRVSGALFLPPGASRMAISIADTFEKYGDRLCPGFGGALLVEAGKELYAPLVVQSRSVRRKLVLTLPPLPISPAPIPT